MFLFLFSLFLFLFCALRGDIVRFDNSHEFSHHWQNELPTDRPESDSTNTRPNTIVCTWLRLLLHRYDALLPRLSETYPAMFPREVHSLDSFTWAALTVWSRAFDLGAWESTVPMWGMVPFADLTNHAPFVPISYSIDENSYEFVAPVSLESGEEIFISYGDAKTTFHYVMFCESDKRFHLLARTQIDFRCVG